MADSNPKIDPAPHSNTEKDPDDWTTGDEPMTGAQASYLKTLCEQTGGIDALRAEAGLDANGQAVTQRDA